jgi:signal transduction histidine kinase
VKLRTWPILASGFGTLVLLIILSGLDSMKRAGQIYIATRSIHESHERAGRAVREIQSGIYLSGILIRDFLLDPSQIAAGLHRGQLLEIRDSMDRELEVLRGAADAKMLEELRGQIESYWDSMDPIFDWTPQQKIALSSIFLRRQVLPRRNAVLDMAQKAQELNTADLHARQQQLDATLQEFQRSGRRTLVLMTSLAVIVALASILRISRLEGRAEQQHERTERAEKELRNLSQQLVRAQEDERRRLSRELHDEVGQTLTALRVELGNLEKLRTGAEEPFRVHLDDAKELTAQTLRSVRSLAMGLRPSILDDLGLGPALEWQAREFSRRTGIPVEVVLEGVPSDLPDGHRTCLYRIVQEALTNCARHANAQNIRIVLHSESDRLLLTVEDDGRGMPLRADGRSLAASGSGMVGIEERVRELGGVFDIHSQEGKGTLLKVSIPLTREAVR